MNVLVVDDQISVLRGIASGVHFEELGIDKVSYATSSAEALAVFRQMPVDIMLSDIEMPGENGMVLNKKVQELYPETLRILLTSHAEFSYAQESVKLGCFDYLLQPAPYEEIEDCLRRALQQIYERNKKQQLYQYGRLFKTNETELMDHVVLNLFSRIPEDVRSSLEVLQEMGYPLDEEKTIQFIIIDAARFKNRTGSIYSEKQVHKAISNALKDAGISYPVLPLTTVNPYKQFALLLLSATQEPPVISDLQYRAFYDHLCAALSQEVLSFYIGDWRPFGQIKEEVTRIHHIMDENITNLPGIYPQSAQSGTASVPTNLAECTERWKSLLAAGQKRMLENDIEEYLASIEKNSRKKHKDLCELHQQLTHIFFSFFYDNSTDVSDLFSSDYTYSNYMDSFTNADSLRKAVRYMLRTVDNLQKSRLPKSDVEAAKSFIAENIMNPITVKDVADHVNLSAEYFTKLFKRETGKNIKEYIMQAKVSAAKEMLEHSNISVGMVALELGYSNFSHFTQIFKKYENMTPSEYRSRFFKEP